MMTGRVTKKWKGMVMMGMGMNEENNP